METLMNATTATPAMSQAPLQFSVIIPTHNRERLLPRTLDSVLAQTFTNYEVIIVDDGSTDRTQQVVEQYLQTNPHVRYHLQQNQGACTARNYGGSLASGSFLIFLDDDDTVEPDWLSVLSDLLATPGSLVACCGCRYVEDGMTWKQQPPSTRRGLFLSGTFAIAKHLFNEAGQYREDLPANQQSEFRLRVLPLLDGTTLLNTTPKSLVISHRHDQPNIREDLPAIYQSALFILNEHRAQLRKNARTFASWSTSTGGYAAKLGKFSEARQLFLQAIRSYPRDVKNYARVLLTLIPGLRTAVWHRHFTKNQT